MVARVLIAEETEVLDRDEWGELLECGEDLADIRYMAILSF